MSLTFKDIPKDVFNYCIKLFLLPTVKSCKNRLRTYGTVYICDEIIYFYFYSKKFYISCSFIDENMIIQFVHCESPLLTYTYPYYKCINKFLATIPIFVNVIKNRTGSRLELFAHTFGGKI